MTKHSQRGHESARRPANPLSGRSISGTQGLGSGLPGESQATSVQTVAVTGDESGMRVDRFLEARFPGLSFSHIQRIIRKGELRVNGKRAKPKDRLSAGQSVRIPPLKLNEERPRAASN